jgi:hypothetical protein
LTELGYAYDFIFSEDWTSIDFSPYDVVIIGMDGGFILDASVQAVREGVIDQGKRLIFVGGTCVQEFANGVDAYLVSNLTGNFCWNISAPPHWTLVDSGHGLATGLPDSYNFIDQSAAFYQIRVDDPDIEPVAMNGDGFVNYFLKNSAFPSAENSLSATGDFIWFANSAFSFYWVNQPDFDLFKQLLGNSVAYASGVEWASAVPESGTIPPFSSATFDVVFDARSMIEVGTFTAELSFSGDFSNEPPTMPLTMHLSCPTCGFLEGSITDATTGDPLSADVHITGPNGFDLSLSGETYALAVQPGDYDFTVSSSGYVTQTATVTAVEGETVVTDFALLPAAGILAYSPPMIQASVLWGDSVTNTLTITNTGTVPFDFELSDGVTGSPLRPAYSPPAASNQIAANLKQTQPSLPSRGAEVVKSNAPAQDVLLDQQPNQSNGIFADVGCDLCGGPQVLADNFSLPASEDIAQIVFWTGYFPGDVPIDPDTITVIFHEDSGGLPGTAVYTESDVAYERIQTGVILFGVHEWMHTLTLASPVTLDPGNYWVEIYNDTGFGTDDFFWEVGNPDTVGNGLPGSAFAFTAPGSAWNFDGLTDFALQLLTTAVVDAPWASENPATGTLDPGESIDVDVIFDSSVVTQTGDYTADLFFDGDFVNDVPSANLVMHVTQSAVDTGPDQSDSGVPGDEVEYTVTITNTGLVADTFDLSLSGNVWESHVTPESTGLLNPGESATVTLTVHIPESAFHGNSDSVVLTATSAADSLVSDSMTATTSVSGTHMVFLPALFKQQ